MLPLGRRWRMSETDDSITINHLVGVSCILNESIKVELRQSRQIDGCVELYTEGAGRYCLHVSAVHDMTADGGFVIQLSSWQGDVISEHASIIAESLYRHKPAKRATL